MDKTNVVLGKQLRENPGGLQLALFAYAWFSKWGKIVHEVQPRKRREIACSTCRQQYGRDNCSPKSIASRGRASALDCTAIYFYICLYVYICLSLSIYIYIHTHTHIYIYIHIERERDRHICTHIMLHYQQYYHRPVKLMTLGGTTCLTLLTSYGLICFLRHYLSNTPNSLNLLHYSPRLKNTCVRQVV